MLSFKAKIHQTPLGELTALPRPPSWDSSGSTSKAMEGKERNGGKRRGVIKEGVGKGMGEGGERCAVEIFNYFRLWWRGSRYGWCRVYWCAVVVAGKLGILHLTIVLLNCRESLRTTRRLNTVRSLPSSSQRFRSGCHTAARNAAHPSSFQLFYR